MALRPIKGILAKQPISMFIVGIKTPSDPYGMPTFVHINGRLSADGKQKRKKVGSTGEMKKTVEFGIISNDYISGSNYTTYTKVILWEGQYMGMWKDLKKGVALNVTGQQYTFRWTNDEGKECSFLTIKVHSIQWPVGNRNEIDSVESNSIVQQEVSDDLPFTEQKIWTVSLINKS
eukprot:NODE_139_length_16235_cov_0.569038.p9 type:complete len:176 gc:universal NODE_139_length_16235_cov_0.569038:8472-8999(+)